MKMDLRWGYNNVRIKEGDEWKAVFTTLERSFKPTVMFFRLTNSPATFQTIMNELLRDIINTGRVVVFIDDVIVGTESEEGHDELVVEIIKRLEENDLYVKPERCKWKVREVEILGVVIEPNGIKMEEEKIRGVLEQPTSKCVKDMQKFLGLANYYCQFIEGFALIARPLHDPVKKDQKWNWIEKQGEVFRELKERFTKKLVLAAPDLDKKMRVEIDASDVEKDNENQVFIKENCICSLQEVVIEEPEVDILEIIKKARSKDKDVVRVVEEMKKMKVKELQGEEQQIEKDLVLKEGKVYVLKDKELRAEIIWLYYNVPAAGHRG